MDAFRIGSLLEMGVATGVASLTLTRARPLRPIRQWIQKRSQWWGELVGCPYCISHWVAAGLVAWHWPGLYNAILEWLMVVAIAAPSAALVYRSIITILPAQSEESAPIIRSKAA